MSIHAARKVSTTTSTTKHWPQQSISNKVGAKRQSHKINPLYETPFKDVVTNEYVRGYN